MEKLQQTTPLGQRPSFVRPYRVVPFDIGRSVGKDACGAVATKLVEIGWKVHPVGSFMEGLGGGCIGSYEYHKRMRLYLYRFGIGVFVFCDPDLDASSPHFALSVCASRRRAHNDLLSERHPLSKIVARTVRAVRQGCGGVELTRVGARFARHRACSDAPVRVTALPSWNPNHLSDVRSGLLYVLTFYLCDVEELRGCWRGVRDGLGFKNLMILLQPSLAHEEDSSFSRLEPSYTEDEIYQLEDFKMMTSPKDWSKLADLHVFMSWATVLVIAERSSTNLEAIELIEAMEANLQAMWMYTYCLSEDIKSVSVEHASLTALLESYNAYKFNMSRFKSLDDASVPEYVSTLQTGLVETSGLVQQENLLSGAVETLEDLISARDERHRTMSGRVSELLLFFLALTQLPAMLDAFVKGDYGDAAAGYIGIMLVLTLIYLRTIF